MPNWNANYPGSLSKVNEDDSRREKYDQVLAELDKKFAPWIERIRASERITEEDLKLIINV